MTKLKAYLIAERGPSHRKGPKVIARWPYNKPVPPGVIIGKGTYIRIECPDAVITRQAE